MTKEITLQGYAQLVNGRNKIKRELGSVSIDQTGTDWYGPVKYVLGAGYEAVGKGDITSLGVCVLENPEADGGENAVGSFDGGSTDHIEIEPGEFQILRLTTGYTIGNLQFKAKTSASSVVVTLLED